MIEVSQALVLVHFWTPQREQTCQLIFLFKNFFSFHLRLNVEKNSSYRVPIFTNSLKKNFSATRVRSLDLEFPRCTRCSISLITISHTLTHVCRENGLLSWWSYRCCCRCCWCKNFTKNKISSFQKVQLKIRELCLLPVFIWGCWFR